MELSVIIPTHGHHEQLYRLLDSLELQKLDFLKFEVIVVSNLSDSILAKGLSERNEAMRVRYFEVGQIGESLARNLGIEKSQAGVLYFLDDDCVLPESSGLEMVLKVHENYPEFVGIGGSYTLPKHFNTIEAVYNCIQNHRLGGGIQESQATTTLIGGNMSLKKLVLVDSWRFDDTIGFCGADDLILRLVNSGFKFRYSSDLKIIHKAKIGIGEFASRALRHGLSSELIQLRGVVSPFPAKKYSELDMMAEFSGQSFLRWVHAFWLIKFYDYFFKEGTRLARKDLVPEITGGFLLNLFWKAPFVKWHLIWIRWRINEAFSLLRVL